MDEKLCECGCGKPVAKRGNRFITGHNRRGIPMTDEHKKNISIGNIGKNHGLIGYHHTDEAKINIGVGNDGKKRTDDAKIKMSEVWLKTHKNVIENMCGGDDIVNHHYIYDHNDLTKYTTKMTRSIHTKIHRAMQKAGIIVPHINIKEVL